MSKRAKKEKARVLEFWLGLDPLGGESLLKMPPIVASTERKTKTIDEFSKLSTRIRNMASKYGMSSEDMLGWYICQIGLGNNDFFWEDVPTYEFLLEKYIAELKKK